MPFSHTQKSTLATGTVNLNSGLLGKIFKKLSSYLSGTIKLVGFPAWIAGLDGEIKRR